jgi:glycosyltransferase involved in cell wall biosynthesis
MPTALALDLTGLFLAPVSRTPRGIDRVELAFARHFLNRWSGDCWAILPAPWGVRCFGRDRALRGIRAVDELWRENIAPQNDEAYVRAKSEILTVAANLRLPEKPRNLSVSSVVGRYFRLLSHTGFSFGRSAAKTLPKDTIYLNVGQLQIFRPWFWWLLRRPDVMSVFMIHDVTPIEHPAHHLPVVVKLHHRIVRNTAEFAKVLIFPSRAAQESVCTELRKYTARELVSSVELLPVPDEFLGTATADLELSKASYFIICGSIDPHKNHLFLLEIWKELVAKLGAKAPKLVIAGSPQAASDAVFAALEADPAVHGHVIIATGVSTPGLRRLITGARALLMPSLSEGFGLPIVEALAQGTAVIASDIPAHREAGSGGAVLYLSLSDRKAWIERIEALSVQPRIRSTPADQSYTPKTWEDYFSGIESLLERVTGQNVVTSL